jgi:hypothetical protein
MGVWHSGHGILPRLVPNERANQKLTEYVSSDAIDFAEGVR